jgi:hypothetical protein
VAEMCPNHKMATIFRGEICAEFSKKPHKIEKMHILHIFFSKMCSLKPLIYKGKMPFCTNAHFSKTFRGKFFQKDILALICANRVKIDYYSHIPTEIAYTLLKSKMCRMCKSVQIRNYQHFFNIENVQKYV